MLSEKELMMVEGMNRQIARFITPFITFKQPDKEEDKLKWKNILKYGKQELSTRVDIPLYTRAGYRSYTPEYIEENPNKRYLDLRSIITFAIVFGIVTMFMWD